MSNCLESAITKLLSPILFISLLAAGGCGTIFPAQTRNITIESDPPNAEVKSKTGQLLGTTPYSFIPSKEEKYSFIISKKGYENNELQVKPMIRAGVLFGDAMLLCIPCIIDIPSKSYLTFPRPTYTVDLARIQNASSEEETSMFGDDLYVNIDKVNLNLKDKQLLGKVNSSSVRYDEDNEYATAGNSEVYTDGVCSAFKSYNLLPLKCGISRYEPEHRLLLPAEKQPLVQVHVSSWTFNLALKKKRYRGTETMESTWKLIDPASNKVLKEENITTTIEADESQIRYLFLKVLQKSAVRFIEEDSLVTFLKNMDLLSPETMKGEEVQLIKSNNPLFPKLKDLVNYSTKAVVTLKQKDGFGSGVVISKDGYIITNYHVVEERKQITVKLNTGISLTARVLKTNAAADLALLKVDATDLPSLPFSMNETDVGEEAIAIGTPGDLALEQTVSKGIVSGKRIIDGKKFLQTDVSINPGNSGGPLLNDKGEILGIITMKIVGKGMEGLGFALSSEEVVKLLNLKIN